MEPWVFKLMNVGEIRCEKITRDGEMLCVDFYCLSASRNTASLLCYHTKYVIITPIQLFCKIQFIFHWCFHDINTYAPICGVIVICLMYMYYHISSKTNLLWETPIYLVSASIYFKIVSNISLSIASDLKRKQKQATVVLFRVPSS